MELNLYRDKGLPVHWVVKLDGWWIVPAIANGWAKRIPYKVPAVYRKHRLESVAAVYAIGLGIPS